MNLKKIADNLLAKVGPRLLDKSVLYSPRVISIAAVSIVAILTMMWFVHFSQFLLGLLCGSLLLGLNADDKAKMRNVYLVIGGISVMPPVMYFLSNISSSGKQSTPISSSIFLILWLVCAVASWIGAVWWLRIGVSKFNAMEHKVTIKTVLERKQKTNIKTIDAQLPEALVFDPIKYIDPSKGVFLGLDELAQPVYIEFPEDKPAPHCQVVGTTGGGKGVSLGVMASQFLQRDEAVFFCDPKDDEWASSVMYAAAKRLGKPYHFINIKRPNGPQFNIVEDATEDELFELFQAGFSLVDKGDASDYYGIDDRAEADLTAKMIARDKLTLAEAYAIRMSDEGRDPDVGKKFYGKLREMSQTPSINAKSGGVSLRKVVDEGGCVYFVGSMRNDIVKTVQRMLLIRFIQLAERRDRMSGSVRKICIVLDEVKYYLSKTAQEALGAARDKGVHIILAHQSIGDLKDCNKDMSPDAVVDAVVENCKTKICYQVQSPDTRLWLATMSGYTPLDDESRIVEKNILLTETIKSGRTLKQTEGFLVDENTFQRLKPSTCVLYSNELPRIVSIQPMRVAKDREAIKIVVCGGGNVQTTASKLANLEKIVDPVSKPMISDIKHSLALLPVPAVDLCHDHDHATSHEPAIDHD